MVTTVDDRTNPKLAEVVRRLVDEFKPDRIYLFGSRARGDASDDSDFDILMVVPHSTDRMVQRMAMARDVVSEIKLPTEIIVHTRDQFDRQASVVTSLAATVIREGRLHYASD